MKELKKMSLANMQDSLSKEEMKQIMAGSGEWYGGCGSYDAGYNNCFPAGAPCGNGSSYCRLDPQTGRYCCIHG